MKIAVIGTLVSNLVLGHICTMPMAYAQSMPMQHDEAMEMVMTPMEIMSPVILMSSTYCEHCAHIQREQSTPMSAGCAGHCLSKANDNVAVVTATSSFAQTIAALPPAIPTIIAFADVSGRFTESTAPPIGTSLHGSVVRIE